MRHCFEWMRHKTFYELWICQLIYESNFIYYNMCYFPKNVLQIDDVSILSKIYKQRIWNIYYAAMQKIIVFCLRVFFSGCVLKLIIYLCVGSKINCEKKGEKIKFLTHVFTSFWRIWCCLYIWKNDTYHISIKDKYTQKC